MKWTIVSIGLLSAAPALASECRVDLVSGQGTWVETFIGRGSGQSACRQALRDCNARLDYYQSMGRYPYGECEYVDGDAPRPYPPHPGPVEPYPGPVEPYPNPYPNPYPYPYPNPSPDLTWYSVECSSQNGAPAYCYAGGRIRELYLQEQFSHSPCIQNVSFGFRNDQVWVSRGCRARFSVGILRGRFH